MITTKKLFNIGLKWWKLNVKNYPLDYPDWEFTKEQFTFYMINTLLETDTEEMDSIDLYIIKHKNNNFKKLEKYIEKNFEKVLTFKKEYDLI